MKSIISHIDYREKELFSPHGLTRTRFDILSRINDFPGINYVDLSDLILCTKGNTTRIVASMMEDNLVYRHENPEDRRSFQLFLSDTGKVLYEEVNQAYIKHINLLIGRLNDDQLKIYAEVSIDIEKTLAMADG
jgi:DNA-binding MarR family transcriptional regulator